MEAVDPTARANRQRRRRERGGKLAAVAMTAAVAGTTVPTVLAAPAGASVWEEIQHNIQGGLGVAPNNPNKASPLPVSMSVAQWSDHIR